MEIFQCTGCGFPRNCIFATDMDDLILNADGTCDDLGCPKRTENHLPVWRRLVVR
jgi:hypothetical protein